MKRIITYFGLIILLIITCFAFGVQYEWRNCVRVVDGDTIVLDGNETIRLVGVDTPETNDPRRSVQYFGEESASFLRNLVEGKKVRLEYDQERIDKYKRTLAYVYLEDGTFVNAEIIKQGIGFAYLKYPFKYFEQFWAMEREARIKEVGYWSHVETNSSTQSQSNKSVLQNRQIQKPADLANIIVYVTKTGTKYHAASCRYAKTGSPISLNDAVARGLGPCSICKPPTLEDRASPDVPTLSEPPSKASRNTSSQPSNIIVYVTRSGTKYHTATCRYAKNASPMPLKDAIARGLNPCSICKPPTLK